ncbi:hypothetical protein GA566_31340 [Cupriavidus sp. SW-Y-13]|nr:hypothetical protein [Cupriavidus sp. SW-Y-13]
MPLPPEVQMFVNIARERDRGDLLFPSVDVPGPLGSLIRQPNPAAVRAREMKNLTDEEYAERLGFLT